MTLHYHGTPITPNRHLETLRGRHFCVSHARPDQVEAAHRLGQSVMLDNGAFSAWRRGYSPDWPGYYAWADQWLEFPTTWAVIPDDIEGGEDVQDALVALWPFAERGAPVWHMHESLDRLYRLADSWPRICIGSSAQFATIMTPAWERRMDEAWRGLSARHGRRTPFVHMLRGLRLATERWPFASLDSTNVARSLRISAARREAGHRQRVPAELADEIDARQCPPRFIDPGLQLELVA
jgi:hypothetical protein